MGKIKINRAPVMTLWAAVVAERLGHDRPTALSLAKVVTGLNAQSKGRRLGIYTESDPQKSDPPSPRPDPAPTTHAVDLLGRAVPTLQTPQGLRAVEKDRPVDPRAVERYLTQKFRDQLEAARQAMQELAEAYEPEELERRAFDLYERFRPQIPQGTRGWGAAGELDLDFIRNLAQSRRDRPQDHKEQP